MRHVTSNFVGVNFFECSRQVTAEQTSRHEPDQRFIMFSRHDTGFLIMKYILLCNKAIKNEFALHKLLISAYLQQLTIPKKDPAMFHAIKFIVIELFHQHT